MSQLWFTYIFYKCKRCMFKYFTLNFNIKVTSVDVNHCWYLHALGNQCSKLPKSKHVRDVYFTSHTPVIKLFSQDLMTQETFWKHK